MVIKYPNQAYLIARVQRAKSPTFLSNRIAKRYLMLGYRVASWCVMNHLNRNSERTRQDERVFVHDDEEFRYKRSYDKLRRIRQNFYVRMSHANTTSMYSSWKLITTRIDNKVNHVQSTIA